jgi:predicted transposase YbfD/YdcC
VDFPDVDEITAFGPLLDRIDLTDVLITADALHTQRGHVEYLHQRGGHYLWIVKPNQPRLHTQLLGLPWRQVPVVHEQRDRGHGRVEHRQLKLTAIGAGIGFPHARLAIQLQRRRRPIATTSWSSETIYAVTDLTWRQAPAELIAEVIRGHWQIEALHWIRDVCRRPGWPLSIAEGPPPWGHGIHVHYVIGVCAPTGLSRPPLSSRLSVKK